MSDETQVQDMHENSPEEDTRIESAQDAVEQSETITVDDAVESEDQPNR